MHSRANMKWGGSSNEALGMGVESRIWVGVEDMNVVNGRCLVFGSNNAQLRPRL